MPTQDAFARLTFIRGLLFWTAASAANGFMPMFAYTLQLNLFQSALFLSGAALGRTIFQPLLGYFTTIDNARTCLRLGLGGLIVSYATFLLADLFSLILLARIFEGFGIACFSVAWRTLLNERSTTDEFAQINDSYVLSQNCGRLIGPVISGMIVATWGVHAVFAAPLLLYLACLTFGYKKEKQGYKPPTESNNAPRYRDALVQLKGFTWLLALHHIEFVCLGLWLAGWPIFAIGSGAFTTSQLGLSFSISALGGLVLAPARSTLARFPAKKRLIFGISLLCLQPLGGILGDTYFWIAWPALALGGLGSTIYFSEFHRLLATKLPLRYIPMVYGVLGSSTFLAQALGQAVAPILQHSYSARTPVTLDLLLLLFVWVCYCFRKTD